jgi:hypothetical protein
LAAARPRWLTATQRHGMKLALPPLELHALLVGEWS